MDVQSVPFLRRLKAIDPRIHALPPLGSPDQLPEIAARLAPYAADAKWSILSQFLGNSIVDCVICSLDYNTGRHRIRAVIKSFRCKETAKIWRGEFSHKLPPDIQATALRKLRLLDSAKRLDDLAAFPGNRLEALKGDRKGQHGIRINGQWRICFLWRGNDAQEVEIVDYH